MVASAGEVDEFETAGKGYHAELCEAEFPSLEKAKGYAYNHAMATGAAITTGRSDVKARKLRWFVIKVHITESRSSTRCPRMLESDNEPQHKHLVHIT